MITLQNGQAPKYALACTVWYFFSETFLMLFWRGVFLLLKALNSGAIQKQTQRSLNWPDKEFCWMCFFEETQQRKPEVVKFSSFVILAVFAQPSWTGYQDYITPNKLILSVPSDFSFTPAQQISIKIFKNFKVVLPETVYSAVTFSVAKVLVSAVGEISSDLYGLSGCDILNLTFCRLDFHQLLIKIS